MNGIAIIEATEVVHLQDGATALWHHPDATETASGEGIEALLLAQHRANFDLWHEEDKARDPQASCEQIAKVKHAIDRLNQRRNDLVERMDSDLMQTFSQNQAAPLHSETPGLMIDRMSILSLKIFHTHEETQRESAAESHRARNRARLAVLEEQRADLAGCLDSLFADIMGGRRRFKIYRQMKMYNDPELNPVIYGQGGTKGD